MSVANEEDGGRSRASRPDSGSETGPRGPVWLVGMMGVGKSTVGPALARRLGRRFLDSDREIERDAGKKISEIFANEGEAAFRALERECIRGLARGSAVVALGGGAIAQPGAPELLDATGTVVYLQATAERLVSRIGDPARRPLLAGLDREQRLERLRSLLEEREPAYRRAHVVVSTDSFHVDEIVEAIAAQLGEAREGAGS